MAGIMEKGASVNKNAAGCMENGASMDNNGAGVVENSLVTKNVAV